MRQKPWIIAAVLLPSLLAGCTSPEASLPTGWPTGPLELLIDFHDEAYEADAQAVVRLGPAIPIIASDAWGEVRDLVYRSFEVIEITYSRPETSWPGAQSDFQRWFQDDEGGHPRHGWLFDPLTHAPIKQIRTDLGDEPKDRTNLDLMPGPFVTMEDNLGEPFLASLSFPATLADRQTLGTVKPIPLRESILTYSVERSGSAFDVSWERLFEYQFAQRPTGLTRDIETAQYERSQYTARLSDARIPDRIDVMAIGDRNRDLRSFWTMHISWSEDSLVNPEVARQENAPLADRAPTCMRTLADVRPELFGGSRAEIWSAALNDSRFAEHAAEHGSRFLGIGPPKGDIENAWPAGFTMWTNTTIQTIGETSATWTVTKQEERSPIPGQSTTTWSVALEERPLTITESALLEGPCYDLADALERTREALASAGYPEATGLGSGSNMGSGWYWRDGAFHVPHDAIEIGVRGGITHANGTTTDGPRLWISLVTGQYLDV